MNNLDAIEGTVKSILDNLQDIWTDSHFDDSEYIRNTRAVIEAVERFTRENQEITSNPDILTTVLYEYVKDIWLAHKAAAKQPADDEAEANGDYNEFCFDYIYKHGVYPR